MIEFKQGNLLEENAEALVNTVNCVSVMGQQFTLVATKESNPAQDSEQAIALVHEWSNRKRKLFKPEHIRKAWQRLYEQNWLTTTEMQ